MAMDGGVRKVSKSSKTSRLALEDLDPMLVKRILMRWCTLCMVAGVMIVAWELGFYMASITQDRSSLSHVQRDARLHGASEKTVAVDPNIVVERNQMERRSTLQKQCALTDMPHTVSEYTIRHMLVVEEYKLVYCFIPKVGCSNWKRVLMVLDKQVDSVDGLTSDEVHINSKFKFLITYGPKEREEILREYKKLLFVRHPFERVLSVFRNKLEDLKTYRSNRNFHRFGREIVKRWRKGATKAELLTGENTTWSEFVQYLTHTERRRRLEKSDFYFSDHWTEMYKISSPCGVDYDFIGHLEDVADESKYFLEKLGVSGKVKYLGADTSRPTNSSEKSVYEAYFTQLPQQDLIRLWELFEKDFALFGYPKPWFIPNIL